MRLRHIGTIMTTMVLDWSLIVTAFFGGALVLAILIYALRPKQFLSPDTFKQAKLIEKETVTHNTNRYRFSVPGSGVLGLPIGQHISFMYEDANGKQVMRSYTPVTGNETIGYVDFVIKVYAEGKMSQHVDQLSINDSVLMKGPKGKFKYTPNMKDSLGVPMDHASRLDLRCVAATALCMTTTLSCQLHRLIRLLCLVVYGLCHIKLQYILSKTCKPEVIQMFCVIFTEHVRIW